MQVADIPRPEERFMLVEKTYDIGILHNWLRGLAGLKIDKVGNAEDESITLTLAERGPREITGITIMKPIYQYHCLTLHTKYDEDIVYYVTCNPSDGFLVKMPPSYEPPEYTTFDKTTQAFRSDMGYLWLMVHQITTGNLGYSIEVTKIEEEEREQLIEELAWPYIYNQISDKLHQIGWKMPQIEFNDDAEPGLFYRIDIVENTLIAEAIKKENGSENSVGRITVSKFGEIINITHTPFSGAENQPTYNMLDIVLRGLREYKGLIEFLDQTNKLEKGFMSIDNIQ